MTLVLAGSSVEGSYREMSLNTRQGAELGLVISEIVRSIPQQNLIASGQNVSSGNSSQLASFLPVILKASPALIPAIKAAGAALAAAGPAGWVALGVAAVGLGVAAVFTARERRRAMVAASSGQLYWELEQRPVELYGFLWGGIPQNHIPPLPDYWRDPILFNADPGWCWRKITDNDPLCPLDVFMYYPLPRFHPWDKLGSADGSRGRNNLKVIRWKDKSRVCIQPGQLHNFISNMTQLLLAPQSTTVSFTAPQPVAAFAGNLLSFYVSMYQSNALGYVSQRLSALPEEWSFVFEVPRYGGQHSYLTVPALAVGLASALWAVKNGHAPSFSSWSHSGPGRGVASPWWVDYSVFIMVMGAAFAGIPQEDVFKYLRGQKDTLPVPVFTLPSVQQGSPPPPPQDVSAPPASAFAGSSSSSSRGLLFGAGAALAALVLLLRRKKRHY